MPSRLNVRERQPRGSCLFLSLACLLLDGPDRRTFALIALVPLLIMISFGFALLALISAAAAKVQFLVRSRLFSLAKAVPLEKS